MKRQSCNVNGRHARDRKSIGAFYTLLVDFATCYDTIRGLDVASVGRIDSSFFPIASMCPSMCHYRGRWLPLRGENARVLSGWCSSRGHVRVGRQRRRRGTCRQSCRRRENRRTDARRCSRPSLTLALGAQLKDVTLA